MTNQMKMILKLSLIASAVSLLSLLVVLIVNGGVLYPLSIVILVITAVLFIVLLSVYIIVKKDERMFKYRIAYFKLLKKLRDDAILDFYNKFGIKPQYNKDGKLLTPDEFLGILTKLDEDGNLDPSIYEMLGILPIFDENGKEVPIVLVLKHLIKNIKKEGFNDLKKLKGLYLKGSKKEKSVGKESKKSAKATKKAEASAGKKAGKSSGAAKLPLIFKITPKKGKDKKKDKDKKSEEKAKGTEKKEAEQKTTPKEETTINNNNGATGGGVGTSVGRNAGAILSRMNNNQSVASPVRTGTKMHSQNTANNIADELDLEAEQGQCTNE